MSKKIKYLDWEKEINKVSNPVKAIKNAQKYYGPDCLIDFSDKYPYKYKILNPNTNKFIYFGNINYEDYLKHNNKIRQKNYLLRSGNIKGNWKANEYSKNNISRRILWS